MEQTGVKWSSSILKALGASSVTVPASNPGSKVKQYVAALSIAAVAAMASFAPGVAHAADGPAAQPIELAATYVYPDDIEPEPQRAGSPVLTQSQIDSDNPYASEYKIPERERDFIDTLDSTLNQFDKVADDAETTKNTMPIFDSPAYKVFDAVTSPLDAMVKATTDKGSTANKYAGKAADVANTAIKYTTAGPAALMSDGIRGVKAGIAAVAESRDDDHKAAQAAVDASRDRMARIYSEERARIAAADGAGVMNDTASRIDPAQAGSGGLDTSHDDLDVMFKAAPEKAGKHEHDTGLSR